jgi:hypothetical protein
MDIVQEFKETVRLLNECKKRAFSEELIRIIETNEVQFFPDGAPMEKDLLVSVYTIRQEVEEHVLNSKFETGYDEVLHNLEESELQKFVTSSFITHAGSYVLLTDDEKSQLIGILKSTGTLAEAKQKSISDEEAKTAERNLFFEGALQ